MARIRGYILSENAASYPYRAFSAVKLAACEYTATMTPPKSPCGGAPVLMPISTLGARNFVLILCKVLLGLLIALSRLHRHRNVLLVHHLNLLIVMQTSTDGSGHPEA